MPRFTPQSAREMAVRAQAARRANYLAAKQALEEKSLQPPPVPVVTAEVAGIDEFSRARLARVRKQLNRVDALLEAETDPAKLDKLASASSRLAEQERVLAGKPLPGSLRPIAGPKRESIFTRRASAAAPTASPVANPSVAPSKFEQE